MKNEDIVRVKENLAYIAANPGKMPLYWVEDVMAEARELGLAPALPEMLGCNCPRNAGDTHVF